MNTLEMLKELTENPSKSKIFEATNKYGNRHQMLKDRAGYFELTIFDKDGNQFSSDVPAGGFDGNIHQDYNWKEVPQEVTWQEAIEAWVGWKTILCAHADFSKTFSSDRKYLRDQGENTISKKDIEKGKWYIL